MAQNLITTYVYTEDKQQEEERAMMLKNVALELDRQTFFINFEKQNNNQAERINLTGGGTGSIVGEFGKSFKVNVSNLASILKSVKGSNSKRIFEFRFLEGYVARDFSFLQALNNSLTPPIFPNQRLVQPEPVYIKLHVSTNTTPYDFSISPGFDKGQGASVYVEEFPSGYLSFDIGTIDCSPNQSQGCIDEMNQWIVVEIPDTPNPDLTANVHTNQQATSVNFRLSVRVLHAF